MDDCLLGAANGMPEYTWGYVYFTHITHCDICVKILTRSKIDIDGIYGGADDTYGHVQFIVRCPGIGKL
jgi:hypothetical protein